MDRRGFTLVELAIVVMIIGIIAVIAIPNLGSMLAHSKEAAVKANCHTVQLAAEDFAVQNGGVYAGNVDADQTPSGSTLIAMLPGGAPLKNPFTNAATEPVNGAGANPGETAYAPIVQNGVNVGYTINGVGKSPGAAIFALISGQ
jgi:prepilin-type N-terminal cleavage/methylation domain-containing protein